MYAYIYIYIHIHTCKYICNHTHVIVSYARIQHVLYLSYIYLRRDLLLLQEHPRQPVEQVHVRPEYPRAALVLVLHDAVDLLL